MDKEKVKSEVKTAGAFIGTGAGLGALNGGAFGVVGFGLGIALPVVAVGATVGVLGYAGYKFLQSCEKEEPKKPPKKYGVIYTLCVASGVIFGIVSCIFYTNFF